MPCERTPSTVLAWTNEIDERLIYTAVLIFFLLAAVRIGEWAAQRAVSDEHWRYTIRKLIRYSAAGIFLFTALGILAQRLQAYCSCWGPREWGWQSHSRWSSSVWRDGR